MPTITVTPAINPAVVQLTTGAEAMSPGPVTTDSSSTLLSTIQWSTHSHKYPDFQIQFIGDSPVSGVNLTGSNTNPVVIELSKAAVGNYSYNIIHTESNQTVKTSGPFPFSV